MEAIKNTGVTGNPVFLWVGRLNENKDPLNDTVAAVMKVSGGNELLRLLWDDYQTQEEAAVAAKGTYASHNV